MMVESALQELPQTVQLDVLDGDLVQIAIFVKTQTGEIHPLHIHPNQTVDGLKNLIENVVDISSGYFPELFFEGKELEDGKNLIDDYGIYDQCIIDVELAESYGATRSQDSRVMRPKAWAVALFEWDGEMKHPAFYGLRLERGMVIAMTRIITPLWCEGYDPAKYCERVSVFPFCYVQMTRFDDASFREEFIKISGSADSDVPPLSKSDNLSVNRSGPSSRLRWPHGAVGVSAQTRQTVETLKSITRDVPHIIQATKECSAPALPIFPYPDPDPVFFKVHAGRKAPTFIELALKCNALSSPSDTPSLSIVLRCFPVHPIRISSVTFSLAFDKNEISRLSPMHISGPETEVNAQHTESKSIALKADATAGTQYGGIAASGNWSRSVEDTRSAIYHTQSRIQGAISGGNTAHWSYTENVGGQSGLPQETEMFIQLKYKPVDVKFTCHLTVANGTTEKSFKMNTKSAL